MPSSASVLYGYSNLQTAFFFFSPPHTSYNLEQLPEYLVFVITTTTIH